MKLESIKMYDWDFAPNCRRVRMFLIEKGLEIERVECITPKIALNDSYQVRYPHYMVPMIELEDGTQIGEGLAIWTYLETLHPQPALMGSTALEKAVISAWERRAYDEGMIGHAEKIVRCARPAFGGKRVAGGGILYRGHCKLVLVPHPQLGGSSCRRSDQSATLDGGDRATPRLRQGRWSAARNQLQRTQRG